MSNDSFSDLFPIMHLIHHYQDNVALNYPAGLAKKKLASVKQADISECLVWRQDNFMCNSHLIWKQIVSISVLLFLWWGIYIWAAWWLGG